ncbi:hypothetical protein H5410_022727 [Solanum commersonii]|uniref:SWIM-type domain-containing protein n=1 Tax=Solanum commersonii TaxID=4109 RepID=A0A9J5ZJM8_SOLCO|nr:hypothetical protein H5410_022727 [Solanum commersonii]
MNISILLRHSGIWVSDVNYEGYKVDQIVIGQSITFMNLKALILAELEIDGVRKDIAIRYIVAENLEIVCMKGTKRDMEALALAESRICDLDYIPKLNATNYITDSNSTDVKTGQLYKDKGTLINERALEMLKGKPSDGYKQMPRYIWMLNKVYPNSYIRMQKTENNQFMYLFIALRPLMRGFDYCRPVVVVDGAHHGGDYKGTFVSASTLDGADTENDCSWTWFFEQFKNVFGEGENMCIVSNRNESIMKSVSIVFPNTIRKDDFDKLMAKMVKVDHRVNDYLEDAGYEKWSRVVPSSEYIFLVYEPRKRYIVCLERIICTCGRFQEDEIPCAHTIAVLKHKNVTDMHPYCSDYYKPDALAKTYKVAMVPMLDKEDWTVPDYVLDKIVLPPRYRRLVGRPRKRRNKNADEKITVNKNYCGQCGQEGHNMRTCTFFPKEK